MRNASRRRIAAFNLTPAEQGPVLYLVDDHGLRGYTGTDVVAEEAIPRWLVRQVGYVEGVAGALKSCCPECRERVTVVADGQLDLWGSNSISVVGGERFV